MKFENADVWGFEHAIRGMRNPMNSWDRSDSDYLRQEDGHIIESRYEIGQNDLGLMQKLIKAGGEHRKFMRQIFISVDITAPLYWFKEFDTYKVGTVANSTSTMHKLATTPITIDCFETDDYQAEYALEDDGVAKLIQWLENLRLQYNTTKDIRYWKELIRFLPESWLQTRTVTMNYENLLNMYNQRKCHKLTEWHQFCDFIKTLPYAEKLITGKETD